MRAWIQQTPANEQRAVDKITGFFNSVENNKDLRVSDSSTVRLPQRKFGITNPHFKQ